MKIYLAARYSRREELCGYREQLELLGHTVTSRWLNGGHQLGEDGTPIGEDGESLVEGGVDSREAEKLAAWFAIEDLQDMDDADMLIAFTEPPRSTASRGGRHVELGYAIAKSHTKVVIVVGYRENVFCYLPSVEFAPEWYRALALVDLWDRRFKEKAGSDEG